MDVTGIDDPDAMTEYLQSHFDTLWDFGFPRGKVTPILGAGASLFGRSEESGAWAGAISQDRATDEGARDGQADSQVRAQWNGAPSAHELAQYLVDSFHVRGIPTDVPELLHVAQWVATMAPGQQELYGELHSIFDQDFPTTPLHEFFAVLPGRLRRAADSGRLRTRNAVIPGLLVATTNYDDLLERAFAAQGEEFDLVAYMAAGPHSGRFCHYKPDGSMTPILDPQDYSDANPADRTVILKLHGFVDRKQNGNDSFVITEDDYIKYLGRSRLQSLLPTHLLSRLKESHLLFLGYSLSDWNLRAIMYQLRQEQLLDLTWWSVNRGSSELERRCWQNSVRRVEILNMPLEEYLSSLSDSFETWQAGPR